MEDFFLKKFTRRDFFKKLGQLFLGIGLFLIFPDWFKMEAFAGKKKTVAKKAAAKKVAVKKPVKKTLKKK